MQTVPFVFIRSFLLFFFSLSFTPLSFPVGSKAAIFSSLALSASMWCLNFLYNTTVMLTYSGSVYAHLETN